MWGNHNASTETQGWQQQSCYHPRFDKTRGMRGDLSLEVGVSYRAGPLR